MRSFNERDPVRVGIASLVVLVLAAVTAINAEHLPIIGGGITYTANVREAGGVKADDRVRLAGVLVGTVTDVRLVDAQVKIDFRVKDAFIGDHSRAAIKMQSVLGSKYLAIESAGAQPQDPDDPLPEDTAESLNLDVLEAFGGLAERGQQVDTEELVRSFEVMTETFADTPANVKKTLGGLSKLSRTVATRDNDIARLLNNTKQISKTLADRNGEVEKLLSQGNSLLRELQARKKAIDALLTGARDLARQLNAVIDENSAQFRGLLGELSRLTGMLQRNRDGLAKGIDSLAVFTRLATNTLGNGHWIDGYICGLLPPAMGPINASGCG